jgi:hypothetical protein
MYRFLGVFVVVAGQDGQRRERPQHVRHGRVGAQLKGFEGFG